MPDLSIRGICRRYLNRTGTVSLKNNVLGGQAPGVRSVRDKLESLAREEHSFGMSECIFGWTAAFEQVWTHITIRISLSPDAGIANATMNNCRTTWANGIENIWNDHWAAARGGELPCRFTFDVQWVNANSHHNVRVRVGPGGTNMTLWDTTDTGGVAAHEFGHMFGLVDEYTDADCPGRSPVNTGTVMDNNSNNVPSRMMDHLADNIGSNVVSP